jgi:hypothetical protein
VVRRKRKSKKSSKGLCDLNQVQVKRLAELNIELFSCVTRILRTIEDYSSRNHISIPDDPKVEYLVGQALCLIDEINGTNTDPTVFSTENNRRRLPKTVKDHIFQ